MNTQPDRTFRLDRLYFQFLKPKGISMDQLFEFQILMLDHGFINMTADLGRYTETTKLTSREHRDELFKLIQGLKHETS